MKIGARLLSYPLSTARRIARGEENNYIQEMHIAVGHVICGEVERTFVRTRPVNLPSLSGPRSTADKVSSARLSQQLPLTIILSLTLRCCAMTEIGRAT